MRAFILIYLKTKPCYLNINILTATQPFSFFIILIQTNLIMKQLKFIVYLVLPLLLTGCWGYGTSDDQVFVNPSGNNYDAVTMDRPAFEAAVQLLPPTPVVKSGKIYIKDNLLFVNDVNKGFHIYRYDDPAHPVALNFLQVPGATDIAMRGGLMYINQATDLVTINYFVNSMNIVKRNKDVFPPLQAPDGSFEDVADDQVIIDWIPQ
jgi:hypothetical protein